MSIACKVRPIGGEALLPDGYRRCEYLESTGAQWVVTNEFKPDYIEAEFVFQFTQIKGVRQLFGLSSASPYFGINAAGNWDKLNTSADLDIHRLTMAMNRQSGEYYTILDDTRKDGEAGDWWNPETVRWICNPFALDMTGSFPCCIRSYGVKVTGDNNLLCNLIPCLDDKGKPCMFDTVSRTPYYNKGTGEFIYKLKTPLIRKLPRGYQSLEYLEATGTQWIDTGIKLSNDSDFKITCEFFSKSEPDGNSHYAFGIGPSSIACYPLLPTRYLPHFYLNGAYITFGDAVQRCVVEYTNNYVILNDIKQIFSNAGEAVTASESIAVFSSRLGVSPLIGHIHSFGISRNGILQLDLIPCLDDKGNPCMWDYVTRRPFYNQNTTGPDFLYG